jgi:hypothetical protein
MFGKNRGVGISRRKRERAESRLSKVRRHENSSTLRQRFCSQGVERKFLGADVRTGIGTLLLRIANPMMQKTGYA